MSHHDLNAVFYSTTYHPIQAGSIDGTDTVAHDNAVYRAMLATTTGLYDPVGDPKAYGNPHCVVFVGRLSKDTTESTLREVMSKYGRIKDMRLVRHIVTGASQGYAFVEYETEKEMQYAYEAAHLIKIDGSQVLVDYNRQLLMPGWIPRRLGGGLGGRKESGQLRFGGRDRPFRKPLRPIPEEELEKLGIPLPGGYMHRYEIPPLPRRKSDQAGMKSKVDENVCEVKTTDYKRRHDERHSDTRCSYGEMDEDRRLDDRYERRKTSEDRTRNKQHYYEHYDRRDHEQDDSGRTYHHDGRDYERQHDSGKRTHHYDRRDYEEVSGRTHHHDKERKKEGHRMEEDSKHHRHYKREDDNHGSRRHKRSHHSQAPRSPSVSYSSETEAGGKARKVHRPDDGRYDTKEPSVDDRWKP